MAAKEGGCGRAMAGMCLVQKRFGTGRAKGKLETMMPVLLAYSLPLLLLLLSLALDEGNAPFFAIWLAEEEFKGRRLDFSCVRLVSARPRQRQGQRDVGREEKEADGEAPQTLTCGLMRLVEKG